MTSDNFQEIYIKILQKTLDEGILWAKAKTITPISFTITNPVLSLINHKKNWSWAFVELANRLAFEEKEMQNPGSAWTFRPAWKRKLEKENGEFHYSYGEEYTIQIPHILKKLKLSADREAILTMWKPEYLYIKEMDRRPCTLNIHFFKIQNKLHCSVYMRTVDIMNLLPYDVFHHTMLQRYLASVLGIELGNFNFNASFGYYQKKRDVTGSVQNTLNALSKTSSLDYCDDWRFGEKERLEITNIAFRLDRGEGFFYYHNHELSSFGQQYANALIYIYQKNALLKGSEIINEFKILLL
ncbi:MAG TPA: thymidylate synthase [Candidatus Nanoarchaeia archaeon]|nr:thymidylate synthase [Candidatus Nanoarchaeia archaeon]